jgi:SAM-dependent methyltransferase
VRSELPCWADPMDGYDETTYGEAFADVYDDWYAAISDVDTTTATLVELAEGGPVLELGVGTGRLSVPLAEAGREVGVAVTGLDASRAMLDRLAVRDPERLVEPCLGNMAGPLPRGPYRLVIVAYNTLFNLTSAALQEACFREVAAVLTPGGRFVVEAFVPDPTTSPTSDVSVRTLTSDRVVLSVSRQDPERQTAEGQFVELSESGGVRLRPWSIRYSTPAELDRMADDAGFDVEHRWASFDRAAFHDDDGRHVTVFRRR